MASVEITDNTIIRSLVRKGTNDERKQISLAEGELGFTTDTKRLYIGDGSGIGNATGVKYLGTVNDFTTVASLNPMPGDYFKLGSGLYARKNGYQGSVSLENDNAAVEAGYDKIGLAANVGNGLILNNDNLNVDVDGVSILIDGNQLKVGEVLYDVLPSSSANSLLGNSSTDELPPDSISVNQNSVLGRIASSNVDNVTFDQILSNAVNPTVSSLKITGLNNAGVKAVYVDNNGNLTNSPTGLSNNFIASNPGGSNYLGVTYYNTWAGTTFVNNVTLASSLNSFTDYQTYLGYGVSMVIDAILYYKEATLDINDVRIAVQNSNITWNQIQDFHFQYVGGHRDGGTGFFGYRNALAGSNIMLTSLPFNISSGSQRGRYDASYHIIPNSYVSGTEELTIHVGSNTDLAVQVRLVGITLRG
jgi:hypothetical protein